jgi:hypothetical protein
VALMAAVILRRISTIRRWKTSFQLMQSKSHEKAKVCLANNMVVDRFYYHVNSYMQAAQPPTVRL